MHTACRWQWNPSQFESPIKLSGVMFESAIQGLAALRNSHGWLSELAGILPLSALIDFLDIPPKLHIFQLTGAAPWWSWPITPSGSRLLLSDDQPLEQSCYLDRHGNSLPLLGLDGRYGDQYNVSSPETIRLCLRAHSPHIIKNLHDTMKGDDLRLQKLEVIHVSRTQTRNPHQVSSSWLHHVFLDPWWMYSPRYLATATLGWATLLAMITMSAILKTYLSLAFFILMPLTGSVVFALYGANPRSLLVDKASRFNRLVLVTEHVNSTDWIAFYGESTIVNSLLNRPLSPKGLMGLPTHTTFLRMILRVFILGQWALILGAAATKEWDAYFITFWIALCICLHAYVIPAQRQAKDWMKSCAGIEIERYQIQLSSRRALLNTVMALNPDTFALPPKAEQEDRTKLCEGAIKWIDPILERGPSRTKWEEATLEAMNERSQQFPPEDWEMVEKHKSSLPSEKWKQDYQQYYWSPFIHEGIYIAEKIRQEAKLTKRMVKDETE